MVEPPDLVLAAVPALVASGPLVNAGAPLLEATLGVGAVLAELPLTPVGLVAALLVVGAAMAWLPRECDR